MHHIKLIQMASQQSKFVALLIVKRDHKVNKNLYFTMHNFAIHLKKIPINLEQIHIIRPGVMQVTNHVLLNS